MSEDVYSIHTIGFMPNIRYIYLAVHIPNQEYINSGSVATIVDSCTLT